MSVKKIIAMAFSAVMLLNTEMPTFAYFQAGSNMLSNNTFEVSVFDETSSDELMNIKLGNEKISLNLDQKAPKSENCKSKETNKSKKLTKGQIKEITNVLPDVSVRYKKQDQGLKEDYILHSKVAQNVFDLNYDIDSLQAEQLDEQNILLLDKNGTVKTIISAPYMTDAKGARSTDVSLKISNKNGNILSVKLEANSSWLNDDSREYPVEVDPRYDTLPTKSMKKGDSSEQVALLKNMLFEAGVGVGISLREAKRDMKNNSFGNVTRKFVISFQLAMDLNPTGIADSNTLAALRMHLERKGILDTQEHTEQFLKRAESRSSSEASGFFASIVNYFSRINLADLVVTSGTVAVVVGISAFCSPVTAAGVVYMLIGGAAIGAVAGGISEYVQQRAVGSEVDFERVAIKAAGGALKGTISAIPGVGVGLCGKSMLLGGIGTVGAGENLLCSVKSTGFSRDAVEDALINGAAQGLAAIPSAALARGLVGMIKPQSQAALNPNMSASQNLNPASSKGSSNLLEKGKFATESGARNLLGDTKPTQIGNAGKVVATGGASMVGDAISKEKDVAAAANVQEKTKDETKNNNSSKPSSVVNKNKEDDKKRVVNNTTDTEMKPIIKDGTCLPDTKKTTTKSDVQKDKPEQPAKHRPIYDVISAKKLEEIRMDTIARNCDISRKIPPHSSEFYDRQRENYQLELDNIHRIELAVEKGERPSLTAKEKCLLEVAKGSAQEQIKIITEAKNGDFSKIQQLHDEKYMSVQDIFERQMSSPTVEQILKYGHVISRWQKDGESLTGFRE